MEENLENKKEGLSSAEEAERARRKEKHKEYYRAKRKSKRKRKKIKQFLETIGWTLLLVVFVVTIFILMKELDLVGMGKKK